MGTSARRGTPDGELRFGRTVTGRATVGIYSAAARHPAGRAEAGASPIHRGAAPSESENVVSDTDQTAFLSALEDHLQAVVTDAVAEPLRSIDPGLGTVAGLCQSAVRSGGKRLRPRFAYWAWRVGAPAVRRRRRWSGWPPPWSCCTRRSSCTTT